MIVVFTDAAERDIEHIGDYIACDNPARAGTFVRELIDRCERLAQSPHAFPLVPRYAHAGVRRRPYKGYLIFYRIGSGRIEILHILNGVQDYDAILFPET
ncbi:type II toxin-antitoxin system RelE/ParE family toxin [Pararhizobium sp. YC-54]|uniref:type II toxin-antitoxin system RelE/ParE family toxin n=1 Tax=Pararhizobium sp. YC-54 TaxID=2986920 RepID=UPI0021F792C0|nr:type II toxin-antitoxin system RelE/ParE family toxin [Pararhizobium sp. YC-54]MCV9998357.1 type II toxin-antitoxin system RelE/ParE family toxin [Pararhizobium sp. YC-54]